MTTSAKPSFKELMSQMKQETTEAPRIKIEGNKKKLDDRYTFNQGWYDALLNTDMVLSTNNEAAGLKIDPLEQRQIVEIGVYEGASTVFWSDFYLDHPDSRLISIDPFTGSAEHHAEPEKYPELANIELTARCNAAKSANAAKIEIIKAYSWGVFPELIRRFGQDRWIDLLYIDGAHDPISVARDTALYLPMVKPGGVCIFDDFAHPEVKQGVEGTLAATNCIEFALFTGWQLACKVK
jgi:predicted O-methyltransferase YrrM